MKIDETIGRLKRLDDGALMRAMFLSLLSLTAIFLLVDVHEIASKSQPSIAAPSRAAPFLPPAGTTVDPNRPTATPASPIEDLTKAMTFNLGPGGSMLAEGTIDLGAALRFAREIEQRGEYVRTVELNSPGGSVDDALAISKLIREKRLNTKVASRALCASSCPVILSGGIERFAERMRWLACTSYSVAPMTDRQQRKQWHRPNPPLPGSRAISTRWELLPDFGSTPWKRHRIIFTI